MKRLAIALLAVCAIASGPETRAQDAYPNRLVRLIVPFAPGGNTDIVARVTAEYMAKALKTNVVVENRVGAGGLTGTDAAAKAPPDGYTLCVCGIGPIAVSPHTEKLPYNPLTDFAPVSLINTNPMVLLVNPKINASNRSRAGRPEQEHRQRNELRNRRNWWADPFRGRDSPRPQPNAVDRCDLSGRRAGDRGNRVRRSSVWLRQYVRRNGAARGRHGPCGGHYHWQAQLVCAADPDTHGTRACRLSDRILERFSSTGWNAEAYRQSARSGDGRNGEGFNSPEALDGYRLYSCCKHTKRIRSDHPRGHRTVGQGSEDHQHSQEVMHPMNDRGKETKVSFLRRIWRWIAKGLTGVAWH